MKCVLSRLGDPAKVANVILKIAGLEDPPLRLLIGSVTMQYAHTFDQARAATDAVQNAHRLATDYGIIFCD